jgi:hypothetical protein
LPRTTGCQRVSCARRWRTSGTRAIARPRKSLTIRYYIDADTMDMAKTLLRVRGRRHPIRQDLHQLPRRGSAEVLLTRPPCDSRRILDLSDTHQTVTRRCQVANVIHSATDYPFQGDS